MTQRFLRSAAVLAAGLTLAAGAAACNNDDITSINQNPNSPESAPAGAVFTSAVQSSVGRWLGSAYDLRQMEFLAQHLAEVQYPDEDRYARIRASDTQTHFTNAYAVDLADFEQVARRGVVDNSSAISAPARIMQQWEFGYLTDNWGAVPYSEALKGDSGIVLPKYDSQQEIYNGMFVALAKAANDLKTPGLLSLGGADPIYDGNVVAWQRFANSLRLRYAIRLVSKDRAKADAEVRAALAAPGGIFRSNADMAVLNWPGGGAFNNSWATNFQTRDDHRMSKTFTDILVGTNDPRTGIFAQPTEDFANGEPGAAEYAGQPNGLSASVAGTYFTSTSRPGAVFYPGNTAYGFFGGSGATQASYIMTFAELEFILAEAAERGIGGLTPAQAAGFYSAGIRASMAQWGAEGVDAFLLQPAIAYQGGVAGLKQIAQQKWVALYSDGGQAWFEWRRSCQPSTIKPGPNAIFTYVPRRLEYPVAERSVNGANLNAAVAAQGADVMSTRTYWDVASNETCQ